MVAGIFVVAAIVFLLVIPRVSSPKPQRHSFLIAPGGVSRAVVQQKTPAAPNSRPGSFMLPRLPHHVNFEATGGPVDVYLVRYPSGTPREQVDEMTRLTEQLAAGQPPQRVAAKGSGRRGRIDLHSWPYGTSKYLALVRSENESEVTLVVHYGP